jgi:protein-L-isoaspartate(D-aspartate) O-methyltransferase
VGEAGRVVAIEVDADLARQASGNLAATPWVDVRQGDASDVVGGPFDAVLVNAGVTHAEPAWLDALSPGGRMILPLTATMPMPAGAHPAGLAVANISKGLLVLLTRTADPRRLNARVVTFVAIFSAIGLRDEAVNRDLGRALATAPFPALRQLRFDPHEPDTTCWCHASRGCWSLAASSP